MSIRVISYCLHHARTYLHLFPPLTDSVMLYLQDVGRIVRPLCLKIHVPMSAPLNVLFLAFRAER